MRNKIAERRNLELEADLILEKAGFQEESGESILPCEPSWAPLNEIKKSYRKIGRMLGGKRRARE